MGGEYHNDTSLVRTNSTRHLRILAELPCAAYQPVLDGLNALSATPWRVNERVVAARAHPNLDARHAATPPRRHAAGAAPALHRRCTAAAPPQ